MMVMKGDSDPINEIVCQRKKTSRTKVSKKTTMNRMHPKPDVQKMLKYINSGNIASLQHVNLLSHTKEKIMAVVEKNPLGIDLEKFCTAFQEEFGEQLLPSMFGFSDVVEMLRSLEDIVDMKLMEPNNQMLLFPKSRKNPDNSKKTMNTTAMREEVIDTFRSIINSLGGISVDALIPEYEARTNQKLNIQKLGFDSFPHFLSHLSELFKTCKREGQVFLLDSATPYIGPSQDSQQPINTLSEGMNRSFDVKTTKNLRKLLEEEFPFGLQLEELYAAYEGFYGSSREDLDYEKHGYSSLEGFFAANSGVMSLHHYHGDVCVLPCHPLQYPKPEQINLSYVGCVVSQNENYSLVERLPSGKVQVVVGEVYTPKHFWVMHCGEHHSQLLDKLMDGMLEFYSSPLGNRYKLRERPVTDQKVVAALYPLDQNFYRAFVLSVEDLTTVKVLFVDYGTVCISSWDQLRLLHRNFFALPAQAIKCSLHGILPAAGKRTWGRMCSSRFLDLVQNQKVMAEVISEELTTVIKLWDTSHEEDLNIGDLLVREGLAVPVPSPVFSPDYLDDSNHTPEAVAASSVLAMKIDKGSYIGNISCSFEPEEVAPQHKGAVAQNPVAHFEIASGQVEHLDVHSGNSTSSQGSESEESLPHMRSSASNSDLTLSECSQIERCSSDSDIETAAADSQHFVSSTPKKEVETVYCTSPLSNEIFISDEELLEDDEELGNCCLIQPVEVSFKKKIHVIQIDGVQYVLNVELPYMYSKEEFNFGITLRKGTNKNIYTFLIENECDIFEPSGEVRATLTLYPLKHLSTVVAQNGCSTSVHLHPDTKITQKWSHKHNSSELFRKEEHFEFLTLPDTCHNSTASGSSSNKTFYRHGAQVEPLRRPHSIKKFGHWSSVIEVTQDTCHQ